MVYPENKAAADHFENLRSQYAEGVQRVKGKYLFYFPNSNPVCNEIKLRY